MRILVDPNNPDDVAAVHRLQDGIVVDQDKPGSFDVPNWDPVSQKTVRDALVTLATTLPDTKRTFGTKEDTDPVRHLIGSANAWGGNPEKDALYLTVVPTQNDGNTVHRLTVGDVPVDGFWSVTVYNKDGYFSPNPQNAYSFNNVTAQKGTDGKTTIQFGGCDGKRAQLPADHARAGTTPSGCTGRSSRSSTARGPSPRPRRPRGPARWSRRSCGPAGRGEPARRLRVDSAR